MPVDITQLESDPEFKALPAETRRRIMQQALQENAQAADVLPPVSIGPIEALRGAFQGAQRLPWQAKSPETQAVEAQQGPGGTLGLPTVGMETMVGMLGETAGEQLGAKTGAAVLTPLLGPAGPAVGGILGAIGGGVLSRALTRRAQTGEFPGGKEIASDAIWTGALHGIETGVRGFARYAMSGTKGAQQLRYTEAARKARELPEMAFQPMPMDDIRPMFAQVSASGVRVPAEDMASYLTTLTPGKRRDLLQEVALIDLTNKTGGRFGQIIDAVLAGSKVGKPGIDIGQAQTLSSQLRKRIDMLESFEARQLLTDFRNAVDAGIFSGRAIGPAQHVAETSALLKEARAQYARRMAANEMSHLVEVKITGNPATEDLMTFRLGSFLDELRRGGTETAQSINRALTLTPGAEKRFNAGVNDIRQLYDAIAIPLADVTGFRRNWVIAGLGNMLSLALLSDAGRSLFKQSVLQGRGTVSVNALAIAASAARTELGLNGPGREEVERAAPGITLGDRPRRIP
jgi:hypothetical protein